MSLEELLFKVTRHYRRRCFSERAIRHLRWVLVAHSVLVMFLDRARPTGKTINKVVVVCHRHHYERCRLILDRDSITAIPPHRWYSGYGRDEAQPRVMSPDECIVNDFASMATMRRPSARQ